MGEPAVLACHLESCQTNNYWSCHPELEHSAQLAGACSVMVISLVIRTEMPAKNVFIDTAGRAAVHLV